MTPFFIFPVNAGDQRGSLSNVARLALIASAWWQLSYKLDPVSSTVCYEMMKFCTGSVQDRFTMILGQ